MFTGIIRKIGVVKNLHGDESLNKLHVFAENFFAESAVGDSIAINGVCLTITKNNKDEAWFDLATETIRKTSLSKIEIGKEINLEKSLKLGQNIDGHLVYGHVDQTATISEIVKEAETWKYKFTLPLEFLKFIAPKGSISIDGVSLTVGEAVKTNSEDFYFSVYVIPHTFKNTIFNSYKVGEEVNIEIDPLARYAVSAIANMEIK